MVYDLQSILDFIDKHQYAAARFFHGHVSDKQIQDKTKMMFEQHSTNKDPKSTPETLKKRVQEIADTHGGKYTFLFAEADGTPLPNMKKFTAEFRPKEKPQFNGNMSPEYIQQQIQAGIAQALEAKSKDDKIAELEKKLEDKSQYGDMFMQAINVLMFGQQQAAPMNAPPPTPNDFEKDLGYLVEQLGEQTICKLVAKMKSGAQVMGQPIKDVVINFANS